MHYLYTYTEIIKLSGTGDCCVGEIQFGPDIEAAHVGRRHRDRLHILGQADGACRAAVFRRLQVNISQRRILLRVFNIQALSCLVGVII